MDSSAITQPAAQAMIRFGLGRRGTQPVPADPRAWLLAQLDGPDAGPTLPGTAEGLEALRYDRTFRPDPPDRHEPPLIRTAFRTLIDYAVATDRPFRERLVWFWTNHFSVSIRQGGCGAVACGMMQEAIRPHVTGRFVDMLAAVMHHPAMLMYLDNAASIGPDSEIGQKNHRGLNENLARECLELHTVSPAAGYTQADVTQFAAVLTGWSVETRNDPLGTVFRPRAHEPGEKVVLGQTMPEGAQGLDAALYFLGTHPATYRHLALKLVRHFVADDPPPDSVRRIEAVLRDSHGDLGAASRALVALPAAWATPLTKLRAPQDYVIAVMRAADLPVDKRPDPLGIMGALGQPLFNAPLPNGWADTAADWAAPEAMLRRIDWAFGYAGRLGETDAAPMAEAALGPLLRPATLDAIHHAGSRRDALTLLFTSPEFQRR